MSTSIHLKKYESTELVRSLIDDDQMEHLVSQLSDYYTRDQLVSYAGKVNPEVLAGWSILLEGLQTAYGDEAILAEGFSIYRTKTRAELEETAVNNLRSDRYWHPGNYADITQDMIEVQET